MDRLTRHGIVAAGLALVVTGCAGTGSMSTMPPVSSDPGIPSSEEALRREYAAHPEFHNQYGLEQINAHFAYARGATGKGVTLGIVDSGVDPAHPRFEGRLETSNFEGYAPDFGSCDNPASDGSCLSDLGHGTFVAGIMAASRRAHPDGNAGHPEAPASAPAVHGVAFDAEVISVGFPSVDVIVDDILSENPTPEQIQELPELIRGIESALEPQFASAFRRLNGLVTAVNASFGLPGNIEDFGAEELRGRFPNVIEAVAQKDTPADERTVYVWAAGNARGEINLNGSVESGSSVEILAGLPVRIAELRGHSLVVVATDLQGRIAEFSNRCGIAREFCLAAPGVDITGPVPGFYCPAGARECYLTFEEAGTSSSAPFVTGGIGLLAQHYRGQLGNDAIVERMLTTADRTGQYADSNVYGQGFLDLDAATRPVGETRMLTGHSLAGPSAAGRDSTFHLGAAFGDSLTQGMAHVEVASFDNLDAPFFRPLSDHLRPSTFATPSLAERLETLGGEPRGTVWRTNGTELRLRLDPAATPRRAGSTHGWGSPAGDSGADTGDRTVPGSLGSLSLTHDFGNAALLFGYRAHPGWRFGLHAGDGTSDHGFGSVTPGMFTDDSAFANPFPGFARDGASVGLALALGTGAFQAAAFHGTAQYGERRDTDAGEAMGVLTEYRFGDSGLAVQAGWLTEAAAVLGSRPSGAFGAFTADTVITGLSAARHLSDGWSLLASAHAGLCRVEKARHGMLHDVSALWTGAYAVGLVGEAVDRSDGRLALRLSQPLRVEEGDARLRWVSGRTPDGGVTVERTALELEPSGRQLDLELVFARPWAGGEAHLAAIASRDAGHVRGVREAALLARYRLAF